MVIVKREKSYWKDKIKAKNLKPRYYTTRGHCLNTSHVETALPFTFFRNAMLREGCSLGEERWASCFCLPSSPPTGVGTNAPFVSSMAVRKPKDRKYTAGEEAEQLVSRSGQVPPAVRNHRPWSAHWGAGGVVAGTSAGNLFGVLQDSDSLTGIRSPAGLVKLDSGAPIPGLE